MINGKKLFLGILLLGFFSCVSPISTNEKKAKTAKDKYDVYLLIGQSNMAGRGRMIASDTLGIIEGVWLLNEKGKPEKAVSPLNKYSSIRKSLPIQQIGPGEAFAKTLRQKTGKKILLVVNARGGSNIKAWLPSAEEKYLDEAIRRTKEATKYGPLKGILWHQGESNSGAPQSYMKQLETMVGELRKQLDADNVPFVAGEIAPWHHNRDKFNPIIRTIKEHINNSDWVSSESCGMLKNENDPHFSREGQMILGERYAQKIYELVYKNNL